MLRRRLLRPRRLLAVALLLLVGAVVNVAVAWGIAAATYPSGPTLDDPPLPAWHVPLGAQIGRSQTHYLHRGRGVAFIKQIAFDFEIGGPAFSPGTARSAGVGWPALSLAGTWLTDRHERPVRSSPWTEGVALPAWMEAECDLFDVTDGRLPIRPIPDGFLINTLFYTAILAVPLSIFPIRRRLRARRGRCPKCGYDRAGLSDRAACCPECGAGR